MKYSSQQWGEANIARVPHEQGLLGAQGLWKVSWHEPPGGVIHGVEQSSLISTDLYAVAIWNRSLTPFRER
jgi:hypothetical protein